MIYKVFSKPVFLILGILIIFTFVILSISNIYPPYNCFVFNTYCLQAGKFSPTYDGIFDISKLNLGQIGSTGQISFLTQFPINPKFTSNMYLRIFDTKSLVMKSFPDTQNYKFIYNQTFVSKDYNILDISSNNATRRSLFILKDNKISLLKEMNNQGIGPISGDENFYYISQNGKIANGIDGMIIEKYDLKTNSMVQKIEINGQIDNLQLISDELFVSFHDQYTNKSVIQEYKNDKMISFIKLSDDSTIKLVTKMSDGSILIVSTLAEESFIYKYIDSKISQVYKMNFNTIQAKIVSENIYLLNSPNTPSISIFSTKNNSISMEQVLPRTLGEDYFGIVASSDSVFLISDASIYKCDTKSCDRIYFDSTYLNNGQVPIFDVY